MKMGRREFVGGVASSAVAAGALGGIATAGLAPARAADRDRERVYRAILDHFDEDYCIGLAQQAMRIKSFSGEEEEAARFFVDAMRSVGMKAYLQPVPESKLMGASFNAIGRLEGSGGAPGLILNGHIDHNPVVDGWTKDPFGGVIEDGFLYGFVHMKSACAAYVAAVAAIRKAGVKLAGNLELQHVCGELRGGVGTQRALADGTDAKFFVIGEPSELELSPTHCGVMIIKVHFLGRSRHFATASKAGVNAIEKAAKFVQRVGPSHTVLPPKSKGGWLTYQEGIRGFEGLPQLNVGIIRGGISDRYLETRPALFPDLCTVTLDIRTVPGMDEESVVRDLNELLASMAAEDRDLRYEIEPPTGASAPFHGSFDSDITKAVAAAHRRVTGQEAKPSYYVKFGVADTRFFVAKGVDGLIYGPSGKYLSGPDERCEVEQIVTAAKVYACTIADVCQGYI